MSAEHLERNAAKASIATGLIDTDGVPAGRRATRLLEHLEDEGWTLVRTEPAPRPDPKPWTDYASVISDLLADGYAVGRTQVSAAIAELGLVPDEIRAVVIEPTTVHVFRYSDRTRHQHQPILEDTH